MKSGTIVARKSMRLRDFSLFFRTFRAPAYWRNGMSPSRKNRSFSLRVAPKNPLRAQNREKREYRRIPHLLSCKLAVLYISLQIGRVMCFFTKLVSPQITSSAAGLRHPPVRFEYRNGVILCRRAKRAQTWLFFVLFRSQVAPATPSAGRGD